MSELPMRGRFRYLRFKTFPMTPRTPQCEVFYALLSSSEHSGVPEDSQPPTFPSVGLHPHTWPKWGCDSTKLQYLLLSFFPHDCPLAQPNLRAAQTQNLCRIIHCFEIVMDMRGSILCHVVFVIHPK
jgi:hypothetical protein